LADRSVLRILRCAIAFAIAPFASVLAYVVVSEIEGLTDLFVLGFLAVPIFFYVMEALLAILFFVTPRKVLPIRWYTLTLLAGGLSALLIMVSDAMEGQYEWDDPWMLATNFLIYAPGGAFLWLLGFQSFSSRRQAA